MKPLTDKQVLPEVKRRIRALLPNIQDAEYHSDAIVINNNHSIQFTIRNKDLLLKGSIMKRVK